MFSGLKKRVSSVLQEGRTLTDQLSATYIRQTSFGAAPSAPPTPSTHHHNAANIPPTTPSFDSNDFPHHSLKSNAGVAHLGVQELAWQQLHAAHVTNAAAAERIDAAIQTLRGQTERNATAVSDMQHSLLGVPAIVGRLTECKLLLGDVRTTCERLDAALFGLEDVIEELALQERRLQRNLELSRYGESKMVDLERVRGDLLKEHAAKQQQHERRLRNVQQERQAVFQEAFQADLNVYRTLGTVPSKVERATMHNEQAANGSANVEVTLEEIVLDAVGADTQRLDEFLNN